MSAVEFGDLLLHSLSDVFSELFLHQLYLLVSSRFTANDLLDSHDVVFTNEVESTLEVSVVVQTFEVSHVLVKFTEKLSLDAQVVVL